MSISETFRAWLLAPVLDKLTEVLNTMADDQAQLDAAIAAVGTEITTIGNSIQAAITSINAAIAKLAAGGSPDFTTEVTGLQSMQAALTASQTALDAAEANLKGPAGA